MDQRLAAGSEFKGEEERPGLGNKIVITLPHCIYTLGLGRIGPESFRDTKYFLWFLTITLLCQCNISYFIGSRYK